VLRVSLYPLWIRSINAIAHI